MTREEELGIIIDGIENLDNVAMETARKKWNSIAKPLHSLGKLEEHIIRIAGITGNAEVELKNRALIAMCADNGVVEEGVTHNRGAGSSFQKILCYNCSYFLSGLCHTFFHDTIICTHSYQCRGRSVSDRHWYGS